MDAKDSLLLIELDKGGEQLGPLFEEPRRRLQEDTRFRAAWMQYQALRALAWEATPELDERLVRQGLQASRRQEVERRLARATGSQDAARELLLVPSSGKRSGLPIWVAFLLLVGALGLGWMAFGPNNKTAELAPIRANDVTPVPSPNGDGNLAFEFPAQTGVSGNESLVGQAPASDETHAENTDARRARRLVQEQLHHNDVVAAKPAPTAVPMRTAHPAPTRSLPRPTEKPSSSQFELVPDNTVVATQTMGPTSMPSAVPTAWQPKIAAPEKLDASALEASLLLSSPSFPAQAILNLPEAGSVDLRLFDMRGRLVHRFAAGDQAAGSWRYTLNATDEEGHPLPKGNYYLRVITRWFSKVEALEQL